MPKPGVVKTTPRVLSNSYHAVHATNGTPEAPLQRFAANESPCAARCTAGPAACARLRNAFDRCLPKLKKFQTTDNTSAHELCNQHKFKSCYRLVSLQTANGSRPSRFAPGSSANTCILQAWHASSSSNAASEFQVRLLTSAFTTIVAKLRTFDKRV